MASDNAPSLTSTYLSRENPYHRLVVASKSLAAGTCAGMLGKMVEYPFDTVKVRLQTQNLLASEGAVKFKGPIDCLVTTVRNEGVRGLYRGVGSPIVGAIGENMSCFLLYDQSKLFFQNRAGQEVIPLPLILLCGGISGFGTTAVLTPVELVKCRLQIQQSSANAKYRGVIHCASTVFREEGIRGLYRGALTTACREVPGNAIWFGTYEFVARSLLSPGQKRSELGPLKTVLAGGCAGSLYWFFPFPVDTTKSFMQTSSTPLSFKQAFMHIFRKHGIRGLYQGCAITVLRAFPSNAIIFSVYEQLSRLVGV